MSIFLYFPNTFNHHRAIKNKKVDFFGLLQFAETKVLELAI